MINLRDYQQEIYNGTIDKFKQGHKGVCCVLPCRSGKSYIMAYMIQRAKGNVLVLAHRHTLINQHVELLNNLNILTDKVRVESVFTEASRLGRYAPDSVNLIIIDEAHLSEAASYRKVCEYYNCHRVLFTATPARLDGKPLTLATALVTGITASELIERGAISDYDYYAPDLNLDIENVDMVAGEFNNGQLSLCPFFILLLKKYISILPVLRRSAKKILLSGDKIYKLSLVQAITRWLYYIASQPLSALC